MSTKVPSDSAEGNPPVDRLLEAVSPQLADELDRILGEFRQSLEAEANVRLKKSLLDRESELRSHFEAEGRRIQEETSETVRAEVTRELESRFEQQLAAELDTLKQKLDAEMAQALERWKQERLDLISEAQRWHVLADFQQRVTRASSQTEMLNHFLDAASRFSQGVAIYLNKPDGLACWSTKGEAAFPDLVSEETIDPESYFTQIVVRSRKVAGVCAAGVSDRGAIDILVFALKRAIENFGLRIRFFGRGGEDDSEVAEEVQPTDDGETGELDPGSAARSLARMLVSEIKLGHEVAVLEGRANADLYSRLQKEIDAGRATYRSQVREPGTDYFHDEVVKILADNDPDKLGADYPGPAESQD